MRGERNRERLAGWIVLSRIQRDVEGVGLQIRDLDAVPAVAGGKR